MCPAVPSTRGALARRRDCGMGSAPAARFREPGLGEPGQSRPPDTTVRALCVDADRRTDLRPDAVRRGVFARRRVRPIRPARPSKGRAAGPVKSRRAWDADRLSLKLIDRAQGVPRPLDLILRSPAGGVSKGL